VSFSDLARSPVPKEVFGAVFIAMIFKDFVSRSFPAYDRRGRVSEGCAHSTSPTPESPRCGLRDARNFKEQISMRQQSCDYGLNRGGKNQLPQLVIVLFTPSLAQVGELLLPSGVSARSGVDLATR